MVGCEAWDDCGDDVKSILSSVTEDIFTASKLAGLCWTESVSEPGAGPRAEHYMLRRSSAND